MMPTARMAMHEPDTAAKSSNMVGLAKVAPLRNSDVKRVCHVVAGDEFACDLCC